MSKFIISDYEYNQPRIKQTECCGIYEMYNIDKPPLNCVVSAYEILERDFGIVIFHDAVRNNNGQRLCDFIRRHKLGKVTASRIAFNPNSDNNIRMWIWYIDWSSLSNFIQTKVRVKTRDGKVYTPEREAELW